MQHKMSDCSLLQCVVEYPPMWCTDSAIWLLDGWCHMKLLLSQCTFCVCTSLQSWSKPHAFIWSLSACCYFFVLFLSFHKPSNSDMDSRTFNMRFIIFFHTYYSVPNDRVCDASLLGCLSKTFFVRAGDMFAHCHPYGSRLTFSTHRSTQTGCSPSEKH